MTCCLTAPSQHLRQFWLIISDIFWHRLRVISQEIFKISICNMSVKITNLTHWGRVTLICVSELTVIGSDNGLSPERRQAIIWTNAGILLIGPLGTNFSEISIAVQTFSVKKMHLKMSSAKWRPLCLGLNCSRISQETNGLNGPLRAVWVQDPAPRSGFLLPSTALEDTWDWVVICQVGLPRARLTSELAVSEMNNDKKGLV